MNADLIQKITSWFEIRQNSPEYSAAVTLWSDQQMHAVFLKIAYAVLFNKNFFGEDLHIDFPNGYEDYYPRSTKINRLSEGFAKIWCGPLVKNLGKKRKSAPSFREENIEIFGFNQRVLVAFSQSADDLVEQPTKKSIAQVKNLSDIQSSWVARFDELEQKIYDFYKSFSFEEQWVVSTTSRSRFLPSEVSEDCNFKGQSNLENVDDFGVFLIFSQSFFSYALADIYVHYQMINQTPSSTADQLEVEALQMKMVTEKCFGEGWHFSHEGIKKDFNQKTLLDSFFSFIRENPDHVLVDLLKKEFKSEAPTSSVGARSPGLMR